VAAEGFPLNAVLDTCRQVHFGMTDLIRRAQGHAFGAFGLDPIESPYRVHPLGSILAPSRLRRK
jgi:hypothetical protein